jgi:hypothetical protein
MLPAVVAYSQYISAHKTIHSTQPAMIALGQVRMADVQKVELALVQVSKGDNSLRHVRELIFEYTQVIEKDPCSMATGSYRSNQIQC